MNHVGQHGSQPAQLSVDVPREQITAFCRRWNIAELALFGSAARGDATGESDIDLLVGFHSGAEVGFLALGQMKRELETLFRRPVDLVPRGGLKPRISRSVLAEARVLYAA